MTQFEILYYEFLKESKGHTYLIQMLTKLWILAGMVYDPETDKNEIEDDLSALANQIYNLQLLDEWQSLLIHSKDRHNNIGLQEIKDKSVLGYEDKLLYISEQRANYSKILGWALKKAKQMKIFAP